MVRGRRGRGRPPGTPNRKTLLKYGSTRSSSISATSSNFSSSCGNYENGSGRCIGKPVIMCKDRTDSKLRPEAHLAEESCANKSSCSADLINSTAYFVATDSCKRGLKSLEKAKPVKAHGSAHVRNPLLLPPSSGDLLIPPDNLMSCLQVFEAIRHFGRILKISPFGLEDFCASLKCNEQCCIISEIHIALLKVLLLEDEANQLVFGGPDEKDFVNLHMYLIDAFTWPEIVRSYFIADRDLSDLLPIVNDPKYPFVSIDAKLKVMVRLCDYVLASNAIREEIINEGLFISDDCCRSCGGMGDLLCCELCPAVFHIGCLNPPCATIPDEKWVCPVCDAQQVRGVTDVLYELDRQYMYRSEPLGVDRHRRKYWFMARRIIIEGELDIFYYSCQAHLNELLAALKKDGMEANLILALEDKYDDIIRHMAVTEELTQKFRGSLLPYLGKARVPGKLLPSLDYLQARRDVDQWKGEGKKSSDHVPSESWPLRFVADADVPGNIEPCDYGEIAAKKIKERKANIVLSDLCRRPASPKEHENANLKDADDIKRGAYARKTASISRDARCEPDASAVLSNGVHNNPDSLESGIHIFELLDRADGISCVPRLDNEKILDQSFDGEDLADVIARDFEQFVKKCDSSDAANLEAKSTYGHLDIGECHDDEYPLARNPSKSCRSGACVLPARANVVEQQAFDTVVSIHSNGARAQLKGLDSPHCDSNESMLTDVSVAEADNSCTEDMKLINEPDLSVYYVPDAKPGSDAEVDTQLYANDHELFDSKTYYKLGMEGRFVNYKNQYTVNIHASSEIDTQLERDKRRSLSNKFRLLEFKWNGDCYKGPSVLVNVLRSAFVYFESSIPTAFIHPMWYKIMPVWLKAVRICKEAFEFAALLLTLEEVIKPIVLLNVWRDSSGNIQLHRLLSENKAGKKAKRESELIDIDAEFNNKEEDEKPEGAYLAFSEIMRSN